MTVAEWIFWVCLLLVCHTYLFYPCLLFLAYSAHQIQRDLSYLGARRDRRRLNLSEEALPAVSLIIPAYNEERRLPEKLANLRQLDYPAEKLEIVFVSDGSTDRTNGILGTLRDSLIRLVVLPERQGKSAALNEGIALASYDILILSDASTLFAPDSIKRLVRHFSDPGVGVACGALRFEGNSEHQHTEGIYWKYEAALRLMEARLGATLTASGAIYTVRRQAFRPLSAEVVIEDFVIPMNARKLGYRVVYDPEAVATDFAANTVVDEYTRRVRIAAGSFKALGELLHVPLPAFTHLAFISHKLLRWGLPFLMVGLLVSNAFLLGSSPFYRLLFLAQALFYFWAAAGYLFRNRMRSVRYALMGYFLLAMNLAYLVGFAQFLTGRGQVKWQRVR